MKKLTKEDVWGTFDGSKLISRGMIVAQGNPSSLDLKQKQELHKQIQVTDICPIWKDKLNYKSVTVICDESQATEVEGLLVYVHGGDCISRIKSLPDGKIAFRSDYKCW